MKRKIEPEYLCGIADLADIFGRNLSAISNWYARWEDFPRPVAVLKRSKLWDVRQVLQWAASHKKLERDEVAPITTQYVEERRKKVNDEHRPSEARKGPHLARHPHRK